MKALKGDRNLSKARLSMSQSVNRPESLRLEDNLELTGKTDDGSFLVKHQHTGNVCAVADTFAEMFPMWVGRILITADAERWALTAAEAATGLATSIIMSPAEAGIEGTVATDQTPDGRPGVLMQIYNRSRFELNEQMVLRIGQCVMTCPTTSAFNALANAKRTVKAGRSIRLFGDGFQRKGLVGQRKVWKIPVMEGDFIVEDRFGIAEAVAGGNFIIFAQDRISGLTAAAQAVKAIRAHNREVILPFPGGICRSGSKAGSMKYKLKASTNHPFCPRLRELVPDSQVPENVKCVYEIVINGLNLEAVKNAMGDGVKAAAGMPGVVKISAGNYGGKVGPYKAFLRDALGMT